AGDVREALARVPIDRYVEPSIVPRPPSATAAPRSTRPAPHPAKAPARRRKRRSTAATWIWVGIVFLIAAAIGVAAFRVLSDDSTTSGSSTSAPVRAALVGVPEVALA